MKIIDGKKIAEEEIENLKKQVELLKDEKIIPKLAIILVGDNPSGEIYVKNKIKKCEEIGITALLIRLSKDISEKELIKRIEELNIDNEIHGIILQLPLPEALDEKKITQVIAAEKDVDGFTYYNLGALCANNEQVLAATPKGILKILDYENIEVAGKKVVIVGRSNIVGRPLALAFLNRDATVTVCHSKTQNLKDITLTADILVVAIGKANFITADFIKKDAVVIDVGINRIDGKITGDVAKSVYEKTSFITPVPGGVGPMTVAMVISNLLELIGRQK